MLRLLILISLLCATGPGGCTKKPKSEHPDRSAMALSVPFEATSQLRVPIASAAASGASNAWIVTGDGDLFRTGDGGITWEKTPGETVRQFEGVSFVDQVRGWAVNNEGQIWKTVDSGRTWLQIASLNYGAGDMIGAVEQISFVDEVGGWVVEPFVVWRTENGGITWARQELQCPLGRTFTVGYFLNSQTAWVSDSKSYLHRTTDRGQTWQELETGIKDDIVDMFFINDRTGWLSRRGNGGPYRTDDGGITWHPQRIPSSKTGIDSVYFLNEYEGWAGGGEETGSTSKAAEFKSVLFRTSDGGMTWQSMLVGDSSLTIQKIHFSDAQHGWLVGYDKVYNSENGGLNWKVVLRTQASEVQGSRAKK